jgi:hypothetical protein
MIFMLDAIFFYVHCLLFLYSEYLRFSVFYFGFLACADIYSDLLYPVLFLFL